MQHHNSAAGLEILATCTVKYMWICPYVVDQILVRSPDSLGATTTTKLYPSSRPFVLPSPLLSSPRSLPPFFSFPSVRPSDRPLVRNWSLFRPTDRPTRRVPLPPPFLSLFAIFALSTFLLPSFPPLSLARPLARVRRRRRSRKKNNALEKEVHATTTATTPLVSFRSFVVSHHQRKCIRRTISLM